MFSPATVCHALRAVWFDNVASIFHQVAPCEMEHLDLARSLLTDQGGAPSDSTVLSPDYARRMVRNARKVDKSAERFGREVAAKEKCELSLGLSIAMTRYLTLHCHRRLLRLHTSS